MTQDEAVIEAVADELNQMPQLGLGLIPSRWAARAAIRAYLSALDKAGSGGWTVVQKHAITMGQMDAGERALAGLDLTTATPEQIVQRVYFATVQASPPPPGSAEGVKE